MKEIKFRIYDGNNKYFMYPDTLELDCGLEYQLFTGLYDCKGKEIYEKDIVKIGDGKYEIIFECGDFQTGFKKKAGNNLTDIGKEFCDKFEIIGNIYENPELLEVPE